MSRAPLQGRDLAYVGTLLGITALVVVPLPTWLLDALLVANFAGAALLFVTAALTTNVHQLLAFPNAILFFTLFRLGLNVSTTRGVLSDGRAGQVVDAFGHFVARGDVVLGLLMFLIITVVQFLVISKGAERVAEVAARFTLDAMPGKQMSIDADLRSGAIDDRTAREKRRLLGLESQIQGGMDGAMKFVKGDTIAGLIITAINLVAGLTIGITRFGLDAAEAGRVYALLTIGDGLSSQLSALLVAAAAGIFVTKVIDPGPDDSHPPSVADAFARQFFAQRKLAYVIGAGLVGLAFIPRMPIHVLLPPGLLLLALPRVLEYAEALATARIEEEEIQPEAPASFVAPGPVAAYVPTLPASTAPISIDVTPELGRALGIAAGAADDDVALFRSIYPQMQEAAYLDLGVKLPIPFIKVRMMRGEANCILSLFGVEKVALRIEPEEVVVRVSPEQLAGLGLEAKPIELPAQNGPRQLGSSLPRSEAQLVESLGHRVWTPDALVCLELLHLARPQAHRFLGVQDVAERLEELARSHERLVEEVVPRILSLPTLTRVLRSLVSEGIPIRDLATVLDGFLGAESVQGQDEDHLVEVARAALRETITRKWTLGTGSLEAVILAPEIEDWLADHLDRRGGRRQLDLEPSMMDRLQAELVSTFESARERSPRCVMLIDRELRAWVRRLLEPHRDDVPVLSFDDLEPSLRVSVAGRVEAWS